MPLILIQTLIDISDELVVSFTQVAGQNGPPGLVERMTSLAIQNLTMPGEDVHYQLSEEVSSVGHLVDLVDKVRRVLALDGD